MVMSNRSYPADFSRPLREVPVATDEDVRRMLERLRRRCKVGKVSVSNGEPIASVRLPDGQQLPMNLQPKPSPIAGSIPPRSELDLAPAPSAGHPSPADGLHVSAIADKTACADGGSRGSGYTSGLPFQPTRSAPLNGSGVAQSLAEHGVDKSRLPGADPAAVAALQWERISPTAMRTTCGIWTCCKVTVGGVVTYELWRRIAGLERPLRAMRTWPSFDQARQAAQDEMEADNG